MAREGRGCAALASGMAERFPNVETMGSTPWRGDRVFGMGRCWEWAFPPRWAGGCLHLAWVRVTNVGAMAGGLGD